jgi:DNA-binding NarL/FixJ family response regulator
MRHRSNFSPDVISRLLLKLYETPLIPSEWPVFLRELTETLDLPAMTIQDHDFARRSYQFNISFGMDPGALSDYEQHFGRIDPYWPEFFKAPTEQLVLSEELCPRPLLFKTEFYQDFLARHDEPLGVYTADIRGPSPDRWQAISTYQKLRKALPPDWTVNALRLVMPHVRTSLQLQRRLCDVVNENSDLEGALNALDVAVALLDETGRSVFLSQKAEDILAASDGLKLQQRRLSTNSPLESALLGAMIAKTLTNAMHGAAHAARAVVVSRNSGGPLRISARPVPGRAAHMLTTGAAARVAVIVFIRDTEEKARSLVDLLRALYRLTQSEIRLVQQLHAGRSLTECAQRSRVSIETVRAQLKSIFQKMGVHRQAQLLQLVHEFTQQP